MSGIDKAQGMHDGALRALAELRAADQAGWMSSELWFARRRATAALVQLGLIADAEVKRLRLEQLEGEQ